MNDLLRPSLYGARHEIRQINADELKGHAGPRTSDACDVVGPICESGDFLGRHRELGDVKPDALLAVLTVGAYGFSMSSNYNTRPKAAEVMVDGDNWRVIRARETVDDLLRGERLPNLAG